MPRRSDLSPPILIANFKSFRLFFFNRPPSYHNSRDILGFLLAYPDVGKFDLLTSGDLIFDLRQKMTEVVL